MKILKLTMEEAETRIKEIQDEFEEGKCNILDDVKNIYPRYQRILSNSCYKESIQLKSLVEVIIDLPVEFERETLVLFISACNSILDKFNINQNLVTSYISKKDYKEEMHFVFVPLVHNRDSDEYIISSSGVLGFWAIRKLARALKKEVKKEVKLPFDEDIFLFEEETKELTSESIELLKSNKKKLDEIYTFIFNENKKPFSKESVDRLQLLVAGIDKYKDVFINAFDNYTSQLSQGMSEEEIKLYDGLYDILKNHTEEIRKELESWQL
ncbi:hypothetical protein B7939_01980 [Eggerthia catenaformis]|nr:hypothetical protein B7939_01980 [Eggerthia catenaformis]